MIKLRDYQEHAVNNTIDVYEQGEFNRLLIVLATGGGKTLIFSEIIKRIGGRALVIAHRDELLVQAGAKLSMFVDKRTIGLVKATSNDVASKIVLASIQTLSKPARLEQLKKNFDVVVIDECHRATADTYKRTLRYFNAFESNGPLVIGVTATPCRTDGEGLGNVFQALTFKREILLMMLDGYLCDIRSEQIRLNVDFNKLRTQAGDFIDSEVSALMKLSNAPEVILKAYRDYAENRKTLIFAASVDLAYEIAREFSKAGIPTEAIDGTTEKTERRNVLERFANDKTRVVVNCACLTEGYDESSIACIIMAKPTKSKLAFTQMIGRGSRTHPSKSDTLILDVVGSTNRADLMTTATLFDLSSDEANKSVVQAHTARIEREERQKQLDLKNLELSSRRINLFDRRLLHWIVTEKFHVLTVNDGLLVVQPDGDAFSLFHVAKGVRSKISDGLSLDYARGAAEDYARNRNCFALVDARAAWRKRPISNNQAQALNKLRINFMPNTTCGEASDLLTHATIKRNIQAWK